jgi:uncharacterized protein YfiM (DUF2279 family)
MICSIALIAALCAPPDSTVARRITHPRAEQGQPAAPDRWFGTDKVKHFFMSALIQSSAYSLARSADASRSNAQIAAGVASVAFGVAKEVRDRRQAKVLSVKDLIWDGAGALAAAALLNGTR